MARTNIEIDGGRGGRAVPVPRARRVILIDSSASTDSSAPTGSDTHREVGRVCRHGGETVRALSDCLIGVVALATGVPGVHDDRDFDLLARHGGGPARRAGEHRRS